MVKTTLLTDQLSLLAELLGVVAITMLLTLSARFKIRPLAFKYPRREALVALSLVLLLAVGLWLFYTYSPMTLPSVPRTFTYSTDQLLRQVLVVLVILAPFAAALLIRGQPWRSAGLNRQTLRPSFQLGLALVAMTIFLRGKIYSLINGVSLSEFLLLIAVLALGFAEEFAFRGYVQPRLSAWWGERWGWVSTAILFALWNLPVQILVACGTCPKTTDLYSLGINLLDLLVFGLVVGWIMRKSGNILAPALYHAIHTWVLFI